ncbi:hypothetical protein L9F63_009486, partial [Diploptera punctata]
FPMAAYVSHDSWQYRGETYDEECDSDSDYYRENEIYSEEEEQEEDYFILDEIVENHLPKTWSDVDEQLVELDRHSREFNKVVNKIQSTLKITVQRVERVQNSFLWGCYLLRKGEYKKRLRKPIREMELFHATSEINVPSIVENNFDWRRTVRAKFGKGVSFSPSAGYANTYCNHKVGDNRALILTRVLVGKCQNGSFEKKIPSDGYDTTLGYGNRVYVKYGDNEYYPEYVAYYQYH